MDWNGYVKVACVIFIMGGMACMAVGELLNYLRKPKAKDGSDDHSSASRNPAARS